MKNRKLGEYHFGKHRRLFGIWCVDAITDHGCSSRFIQDVGSFEEAVKTVYLLNGWGEPKTISRSY